MRKQEIIDHLIIAMEEKSWERVQSILRKEGIVLAPIVMSPPPPKLEIKKMSVDLQEKKDYTNKFSMNSTKISNAPANLHQFKNNFIDDLSMEKKEMNSDSRMTAGISPRIRRPPSNDSKSVNVNCQNCGKVMLATSYEVKIKKGLESSFTCPGCMKNSRSRRND